MFARYLSNPNNKNYGSITDDAPPAADDFTGDKEERLPFSARKSRIWKVIGITSLLLSGFVRFLFISQKMTFTERQTFDAVPDAERSFAASGSIDYINACLKNNMTNICEMPKISGYFCHDNLGKPRGECPQLTHHVAKNFYEELKKEGIRVEPQIVPAVALVMIQNELDAQHFLELLNLALQGKFDPCAEVVPVAVDKGIKYAVDYQHRNAVCKALGRSQHIMAIFYPVKDTFFALKKFPGVTTDTPIYEPPNGLMNTSSSLFKKYDTTKEFEDNRTKTISDETALIQQSSP